MRYADLRYISQEAAEREPADQRLSFDRRAPSPGTAAMLRKVAQPALSVEELARLKTGKRPRRAS